MVTVPVAIQAFLESEDYEDALRNAISVGGDTDTNAAMAGAIAWEYYKCAKDGKISMEMYCMKEMAMELIPEDMRVIIKEFQHFIKGKVSECKS